MNNHMPMPTLRDVADLAQVSRTTASYVLSGRGEDMKICQATCDRVQRCAEELGYRGNFHARALLAGRSRALGLVTDMSLRNRMWGAVSAGVEEAAHAVDLDLLVVGRRGDESGPARGERYLREHRVDALICWGFMPPLLRMDPGQARTVIVQGENTPYPYVRMDPAPGIAAAVEHLVGLGHRAVAFVGLSNRGEVASGERLDILRTLCRERGIALAETLIPEADGHHDDLAWHIRHRHGHLARHLRLPPATTAVLCHNDTVALALVAVLRERGVRIPHDLSVIGFDDLHAAQGWPALTTISHMFRELGVKAVEIALTLAEGRQPAERAVRVPAVLVVRDSTAPPPAATGA